MTQTQHKKTLYIALLFSLSILFISQCQFDTAQTKRGTQQNTQSLKGVHALVFSELPKFNPGDQFTLTLRVTAKGLITKGYVDFVAPEGLTLLKGNAREALEKLDVGQSVTYSYTLSSSRQGRYLVMAYLVEPLEGGQMVTSAELPLQVGNVAQEQSSFREEDGLYIQDLTPRK